MKKRKDEFPSSRVREFLKSIKSSVNAEHNLLTSHAVSLRDQVMER